VGAGSNAGPHFCLGYCPSPLRQPCWSCRIDWGRFVLRPLLFAALAWLTPTEVPSAPPVQPVPPPVRTRAAYFSELPKAGLTAEMFNRPVRPQANLVSLFSTEDYPLESIRNAEQGTVAVIIRVSDDGRIADCIVAQSSGFPALDSQTCRVLWMRARFVPARDAKGHSVESALRQRIRWELPERNPLPIKPWSMRLTLNFVEEGGILSCRVETTGAMKANQRACDFHLMMSDGLAKLRADADYRQQQFVMETQFAPDANALEPKTPPGMRLFASQVARLTIDETGKPLQCRVIKSEGPEPLMAGCDDFLEAKYERPAIKTGAIEATLTRNLYRPD